MRSADPGHVQAASAGSDWEGLALIAPDSLMREPGGRVALHGGRCASCAGLSFPRAKVCTVCLSEAVEPQGLATTGTLYTFSVVHQAPKGWVVPYVLGYVDLDDGVRVLAHIKVAPEEARIDQRVRLTTGVVASTPAGEGVSTYVFVPDGAS